MPDKPRFSFEFDPTKAFAAQTPDTPFTREPVLIVSPEPVVTMELEVHNPRFMARFKRYEPKIKDSTAIKKLKFCPRSYFYEMVLGRSSPEKLMVFTWGTTYHKFRERLESVYGYGDAEPKRYDESRGVDAYADAVNFAMTFFNKNYREQAPGTKFAFMTKERMFRSLMTAFKHWQREKLQGKIKVIAVEQSFNVMLRDGTRTAGRADQIVRWNGQLWGRDFKTTTKDKAFFERSLEPNDQFTRYTLAEGKLCGEFIQGQLIELLWNANPTKKDTKGPEVIELTTSRTQSQLDTFENEQAIWNRTLEIYRETDIWPMSENSCAFCPFHSTCKKSTEAGQMASLEEHFIVRPWDHTRIGVEED